MEQNNVPVPWGVNLCAVLDEEANAGGLITQYSVAQRCHIIFVLLISHSRFLLDKERNNLRPSISSRIPHVHSLSSSSSSLVSFLLFYTQRQFFTLDSCHSFRMQFAEKSNLIFLISVGSFPKNETRKKVAKKVFFVRKSTRKKK